MSPTRRQATGSTALTKLAERASSPQPWLFDRRGWDWRWRSWCQVADQVARGAAALRRAVTIPQTRIGFDGRQEPDMVALSLAIQAAGGTAVPVLESDRTLRIAAAASRGCTAFAEIAHNEADVGARGQEQPLELRLPPCRSRLQKWRPQPLELDAESARGGFADGTEVSSGKVYRAAGRLAELLPGSVERPIVCGSCHLEAQALQVLLAWTLKSNAAWALEPQPDAFVPAVLWTRPTLVIAGAEELDHLAAALGARVHRRHHRLRAVVAWDRAPLAQGAWEELGVPVIPFPMALASNTGAAAT